MSNVREFGAVGDGEVDDSAALQHALDMGDGVLELERKVYRLGKPLVLNLSDRGPLGIRGPQGGAKLVMAGPGAAIRVMGRHEGTADPASVLPPTWARERMPVLSGFEIEGAHPEADGVMLDGTMQATLSHLLIRKCRTAVHLARRNRNVLIDACHLYDNAWYGVFMDRVNLHQILITSSHISYNKRAGIKSLDGDVHNLQIVGNDIEYNYAEGETGGAEIDFEATAGIISEVTISGNTIQAKPSKGGANIRIIGAPGPDLPNARIVAITGNVIGSQEINVQVRHCQKLTLAGNTIYDGVERSVTLDACDGFALTGNTYGWSWSGRRFEVREGIALADCRLGTISGQVMSDVAAGEAERGGAIALHNCRDVSVTDCQVRDAKFRGVWLDGCRRVRVAGLIVSETRRPARMVAAIEATAACADLMIRGNLVHSGTRGTVVVPEGVGSASDNQVARADD